MKLRKRWLISGAVLVAAGTAAGGSVAFGAWSATTSGSGEAVSIVAQAITLQPLSTGTATLYPGGPPATIYFQASNPNPYAVTFTSASYSNPVSGSVTSCANSNISVSPSAPTTVSVSLPPNASNVPLSIPGVLQLAHSALDGCQGVAFFVSVQLIGAQQ